MPYYFLEVPEFSKKAKSAIPSQSNPLPGLQGGRAF